MKLSSVLNPEFVFTGLRGNSAQEIYSEMLRRMLPAMELEGDISGMVQEMTGREDAIGVAYDGVAYPHLRLNGYEDLGLAVGILASPVKLRESDMGDVKVVILSLVGEKVGDFYLKTLAAFLRYLGNPVNLERLAGCASGEELQSQLEWDGIRIKKNITAEDLMDVNCPTISPEKTLREAFDLFTRAHLSTLPVVDADNRLLGVLDAVNVISKFIPEYVMMLPNAQFLESFETFEALNREEGTRLVKDFMRPAKLLITPDTPLFHCTVEICRHSAYTIFVTREDKTLVGSLSVNNIIHRVLRG